MIRARSSRRMRVFLESRSALHRTARKVPPLPVPVGDGEDHRSACDRGYLVRLHGRLRRHGEADLGDRRELGGLVLRRYGGLDGRREVAPRADEMGAIIGILERGYDDAGLGPFGRGVDHQAVADEDADVARRAAHRIEDKDISRLRSRQLHRGTPDELPPRVARQVYVERLGIHVVDEARAVEGRWRLRAVHIGHALEGFRHGDDEAALLALAGLGREGRGREGRQGAGPKDRLPHAPIFGAEAETVNAPRRPPGIAPRDRRAQGPAENRSRRSTGFRPFTEMSEESGSITSRRIVSLRSGSRMSR